LCFQMDRPVRIPLHAHRAIGDPRATRPTASRSK
jgi:hypothetical protein